MDTVGEGEGGTDWESSTETYASQGVRERASEVTVQQRSAACGSVMTWRGGPGRSIIMCILTADSSWYTEETNTTLQSNYLPIKKKNKKNYTCKDTFYWMALLCGIPLHFNTIYSITSNCMMKDRLLSSNQIKDDLIQCIFTSSQCWGWMHVLVLKLPTILRDKYNFVAEEQTNTKHSMTFHY